MAKKPYLECGQIVNTHGVRGTLRVLSYCDTPEVLASLETVYRRVGDSYKPFRVLDASLHKQFVLMTLEGVADMDTAIRLKGTTLYAAREDFKLKKGDYFIVDLIGLSVIDNVSGKVYGKIKDVINRGASDIYVITTPTGERMMPVVDEFVKRVDTESGIYVEVIPGLLTDD